MQYQYKVVKQILFLKEYGYYRTYAIQCTEADIPSSVIAQIDDVSLDKHFTDDLAKLFTKENLDPIHFMDAVYDNIS